MFYRRLTHVLAVMVAAVTLLSCSSIVTALLLRDLLDDAAPKRWWTGTVTDSAGHAVADVQVQLRAEVIGDDDVLSFSDTTDEAGYYEFKWRYNKEVDYTLRVLTGDQVVQEQFIGRVELADQTTNIQLTTSIGVELSGVISDWNGTALDDVLVIGATADERYGAANVFVADSRIVYDVTNDSGVFEIAGSVGRYGVICAYHPDYGFAYAYGEDTDGDGSVALSLEMGEPGVHEVSVQVVDNFGVPLALRVLSGDQQFRLKLDIPWNLGPSIDEVVSENGLFSGLVGDPSENHPSSDTISVQATGLNGIGENSVQLNGSNFELSAVMINSDDPATALIVTDNPLVLHEDTVVIVRVN